MLGAIVGDIAGSAYEARPVKSMTLELFGNDASFTDDSVLTAAVAEVLLHAAKPGPDDYIDAYHRWFKKYPNAGWGATFFQWALVRDRTAYGSFGNGSAMRVSPVAYAFDTLAEVLSQAEMSAAVTHNHPDGIKGARAIAGCVYLARTGTEKAMIRAFVENVVGYQLPGRIDEIRPTYAFDVSCAGSVPESIVAFLESRDFEDAVRIAVSLGGDTDTMACMAGGIAEAFYGGVPDAMATEARSFLSTELIAVLDAFRARFCK